MAQKQTKKSTAAKSRKKAAAQKPQREPRKAARDAREKYAQFFHRRIYSSRPAPTDTKPMRQPP